MRKSKKRIIIAAVALLTTAAAVFIVLLVISTIPTNIYIIHEAVKFDLLDDESQDFERVTVTIDGKYYNPWFFQSRFEGIIAIEGYPVTFEHRVLFNVFKWDGVKIWSSGRRVFLLPEDYEITAFSPFSSIMFTENMEEIYITLHYNLPNDRILLGVCAPAAELEEAREIADRLWITAIRG
jgi:hypothetical protein